MLLKNLLAKPFPLTEGVRKKFIAAFGFGVFVFFFLYLFKPFGIGTFTGKQVFLYSLGFGGVTFAVMFTNLLVLDKLFPSFFREEKWTVGREVFITLVHIAFIGLGNYFFSALLSITDASLDRLLFFEFISICIGVFPIAVWTLIKENRLLKQNREEAKTFEPFLQHHERQISTAKTNPGETTLNYNTNPSITFTSESETATIKAAPEQVFFISSADNYIKVYLSEGNAMVTKLLRSSLKRTIDDLKNHPQFYRCHRAHIVNLQKVASVTGNARGLKLILENCPDEVPVSRSLNEEIKVKLQQIHSL